MSEPSSPLTAVMTFRAAGEWLGVPVQKMDRIALASRLWPVPMTRPEYVGLLDDGGELVPVLRLEPGTLEVREQLVAILHVRGEPVGLAITAAGQVYDGHRIRLADDPPPARLKASGATAARTADRRFWLIDPDRLWPTSPARGSSAHN